MCKPLSNPTDQTRPTEQKADRLRVLQARPRAWPYCGVACGPCALGVRTLALTDAVMPCADHVFRHDT